MLVGIFTSQRQPVKVVPEMNRKDLLEQEPVSSEPGNDGEVFAIMQFFLNDSSTEMLACARDFFKSLADTLGFFFT
ncbi:hypothetical protein JOQ06_015042 [Pogonophryne albipinna]|uniref:Uncharacterized protein n=1 Tax=Pogonophryne albipinna TaxID=1090488 RepID=A0AAD6AM62_9TELE|nr:hypothetical protein JOQ06_015042 [Pogonophryne albipinna]